MNDSEKALAVADELIREHADALDRGRVFREVVALAYLAGARDGMLEFKSMTEAAFERLSDDLAPLTGYPGSSALREVTP